MLVAKKISPAHRHLNSFDNGKDNSDRHKSIKSPFVIMNKTLGVSAKHTKSEDAVVEVSQHFWSIGTIYSQESGC